jgi:TRAP-type transport system periplasmic protein
MNNCKPLVIVLAILLIFTFSVSACAPTPAPTSSQPQTSAPVQEKPIELRLGSILPPTHASSIAYLSWIEKIQKETNNRVHITPYWSGTLLSPSATVADIQKGVADIGFIIPQYGSGTTYPIHESIELAFYACPSPEIALKVYNKLSSEFPEISKEFANMKCVGLIPGMVEQLHTAKPIRSIGEIKGLRVRAVWNFAPVIKALGGEALPISMADAYQQLQKGLLDGVHTFYEGLKSYNFAEVAKYTTVYNIQRGSYPGNVMNMDTWNKLPPDIQKVFNDNFDWWNQTFLKEMAKAENTGLDFAKGLNHEFIQLPPAETTKLQDVIKTILSAKEAELNAKGLPGTKIFAETDRLIKEYSK